MSGGMGGMVGGMMKQLMALSGSTSRKDRRRDKSDEPIDPETRRQRQTVTRRSGRGMDLLRGPDQ